MIEQDPFEPESWCALDLPARRQLLVEALTVEIGGETGVTGLVIEVGPVGREYDLTAVVETDVGRLRTQLWSHARATVFCDSSIHPANRDQLSPAIAVREAADRLRRRLAVPYQLESRGLTIRLQPEDGVQRTWTAEHSLFRKRTAVVREDRVENPGELDVRDLLAHFYTGPSVRLVTEGGESFLLPGSAETEGPLATLCYSCGRWSDGSRETCSDCGSESVDTIVASPVARRDPKPRS